MSADHYATLGVGKDATAKDIKKAYRSKAKGAHPDTGGDPEKFRALTKAYSVLADDDLRARYDRGENVDEREPDTTEAQARNMVMMALGAAINDAMQRGDPCQFDLVESARLKIRQPITEWKNQRLSLEKQIRMFRRLMGRFKRKGAPDPLMESLLSGTMVGTEQQIAQGDKRIEPMKMALTLLDGLKFEQDAPTGVNRGGLNTSFFTFTTG